MAYVKTQRRWFFKLPELVEAITITPQLVEILQKAKIAIPTTPEQVEAFVIEVTNLRGFSHLVAERTGYFMGRKLKQAEMSTASEKERKALQKISDAVDVEDFISAGDLEGWQKKQKELKDARKAVAKKQKPFRDKISPLTKILKVFDNETIPDALQEMNGHRPQARFSLSKFAKEQLELAKK